ncbi:MAG: thioesterase family protein [Pseudomonadota bacterium]|nr:thioesterase family protein [Pseudomonadota bacterium]
MKKTFEYQRPISYYETDAMGVVHHSNYLRIFEDARVAWLRAKGLAKTHQPHSDVVYAVVDVQCKFLQPLRFGDEVVVKIQVKQERAKFLFRYAIYKMGEDSAVCTGHTLHVAIDQKFKITKPPEELMKIIKEESWTEIWP